MVDQPASRAMGDTQDVYRLMVESVRDYAILMLDPQGHVATWNIGAQRFKGYTAEEIIGKHFSVFYPKEDVERGKPEMELRVAAEKGAFEDEGWRVRKDGSHFWANVIITALQDKDSHLLGFGKVTRDLTERRQTEETIRRQAQEILDLSTPIVQIWEGVVMDLSVVETFDSFFARTVSETAQMVALMGGRTVIAGMRPSVAITATQLGLTLSNTTTTLNVDLALDLLNDTRPRGRLR